MTICFSPIRLTLFTAGMIVASGIAYTAPIDAETLGGIVFALFVMCFSLTAIIPELLAFALLLVAILIMIIHPDPIFFANITLVDRLSTAIYYALLLAAFCLIREQITAPHQPVAEPRLTRSRTTRVNKPYRRIPVSYTKM